MKTLSKLDTNLPVKFVKNEGVLAVLGAVIGTTTAVGFIRQFANKNAKLAQNLQIVFVAVGLIFFAVIMGMGSSLGAFKFILVGISAGVVFAGLLPFISQRFGIDLLNIGSG